MSAFSLLENLIKVEGNLNISLGTDKEKSVKKDIQKMRKRLMQNGIPDDTDENIRECLRIVGNICKSIDNRDGTGLKAGVKKLSEKNNRRSPLGHYLYDCLLYDGEIYTTQNEREENHQSLHLWNKSPLEWNDSELVTKKSSSHSWHQAGVDMDKLIWFIKSVGIKVGKDIDLSQTVAYWEA